MKKWDIESLFTNILLYKTIENGFGDLFSNSSRIGNVTKYVCNPQFIAGKESCFTFDSQVYHQLDVSMGTTLCTTLTNTFL